MAQVTRAASKLKFQTGDVPTQADFEDLHDSVTWYDEGGGGGVSDGDKGDIVVSGSGSVWTLEDAFKKDYSLAIFQELGSSAKGFPIINIAQATTSLNMTSQRNYLTAIYIPIACTITGAKWYQNIAGVYTASNYNGVGLYSYDSGTGALTLVASSTNDGNTWKSGGWQFKAFSSTYSATPGLYFLAMLYSNSAQTTAPALLANATSNILQDVDFANFAKYNGYISTTSLAASTSMANVIGTGQIFYLFPY